MRRFFQFFLVTCLMTLCSQMSWADFKNFSVQVNNQAGTLLTAAEQTQGTQFSFGVAVASDGTTSRVEETDASSVATISGKYHSDHGATGLKVVVPVDGNVKITVGQCTFSGSDIKVTDASGQVVVSKTPGKNCWKNSHDNITELYYTGGATTLTITGMGYCPYVAVEKSTATIQKFDVTFTNNDSEAIGKAPEAVTFTEGDAPVAIPANKTLYKEGFTLTAWTDGQNKYAPGTGFTPTADVTLNPCFEKNEKTLADRTEPVTLIWDFQRRNGAPLLAEQGAEKNGLYVTQAVIDGKSIDVKLDYDVTNGKIANGNWTDWAQMNNGTKFTIPSCKGAVVSIEAYSAPTTTTIDGLTDYTASGNTISMEVGNKADSIDIVIGDGSYYRYIQTVLPVIKAEAGKTYTNEPVSVVYAMNDKENPGANTAAPADAFSTVAFDYGDATITGTATVTMTDGTATDKTGIKFKPAGSTKALTWFVKPATGLTLTPTKVSGYINRCGTDAEKGVVVTAKKTNGKDVALGTFTAWRQGKSSSNKAYDKTAVYKYEITLTADQQTALAGTDGFYLTAAIGVGSTKDGLFGEVTIDGTVSGTIADVNKYTLNVVASPEKGGEVSIYPKSDEYVENDEVTLSASSKFGYDFTNWTDKDGNVISKEHKTKYTVVGNNTLTANFKKVKTYVLDINVEGGANDYMVSLNPAPTVVDGKFMYEKGTKVTLSAASNAVMTFTNWSNGETAAEMPIVMNEDKSFTASYAANDFIVGWDFIKPGNNGRTADFAAADNDAASLIMRDAEGNEKGWLDKSQQGAGGYEGRPAAVCWHAGSANGDVGIYYWQTSINAAAFTDVKVITSMMYNYNAYTTQLVEYSLDGETWKTAGKITMEGTKQWTDATISLPAEANNKEKVFVRWISDKTSSVDGTASANDGVALGATFIVGKAKIIDDGKAPVLVNSVPENNGSGVSANGKIVLTFDKKIQLTASAKASVGTTDVIPVANGKTVTCEYKGLTYSTNYTFTLAAGSVADLTGNNIIKNDITIAFETKVKPAISKGHYDAIVSTSEELDAAIAAASKRADQNTRYRIFIKNGKYVLAGSGEDKTVSIQLANGTNETRTYKNPTTYFKGSNVSFIGEDYGKVIITNKAGDLDTYEGKYGTACVAEGIGNGDVLQNTGTLNYFQGVTIKTSMGDARGRDIAYQEKGNKTIFKDACLWGYQDTYTSNNQKGKFYFEGGVIRGRTDYLCGKGDVYYNGVTLQQCGTGGYLAVPSQAKKYGYVFNNCHIKKETKDVSYYLGRPWGSGTPVACFINTKMDVAPLGNGWADMSGGWPKRFAEYNSFLSSGTSIDLSGRRTEWTDGSGNKHSNDPILTLDDVQSMSLANVMGQDDDWDPTALTEQASAPANVKIEGSTISWDNSDYVFCWVIFKNGEYAGNTTETSFSIDDANAAWTVRAANEMGGLGEAAKATVSTGINEVTKTGDTVSPIYNALGQRINAITKGLQISKNGKRIVK